MLKRNRKKVLIALSGGIDSAVSAYLLLKQGYAVEAAYMKNWSSTKGLKYDECPWLVDRQDALRVAAFLRIPLHTLDFEKQYEKKVLNYFFKEYAAGRTPNPDVMCNKEVKFKLLYNWAMKNGFDFLATGHYAQIKITPPRNESGAGSSLPLKNHPISAPFDRLRVVGRSRNHKQKDGDPDQRGGMGPIPLLSKEGLGEVSHLIRSPDEFKDQTYFIYNIKTEQLPHILFPIGGMKKTAVRAMAKKIKLPNAEKRESMGLCFVGRIRLKDFLEQKLKPKPGKIVLITSPSPSSAQEGNTAVGPIPPLAKGRLGGVIIGQHQGLHIYTIGQRQGINVGGGGPYYVTRKDLKKNILYVTNNPNDKALEVKEVEIHSVNWITPPSLPLKNHPISAPFDRLRVVGRSRNHKQKDGGPDQGGGMGPFPSFPRRDKGRLFGRYRHQGNLVPLILKNLGRDHYRVTFKTPQKAIASGQSLVLYKGKECAGGGIIV